MTTTAMGSSSRWHDLEQRFAALEPRLDESPVKESLSVLHALIGEAARAASAPEVSSAGDLDPVRNLFRTAPPMTGERVSVGLPEGSPAPDFTLPDAEGRPVRLSELRGTTVVLVFYPLDWSPGCSQQLELYQQESTEFKSRGATVLGISADSIYSHGAWAAVRGISFPLLSDFAPRGEVARRYGVWRDEDGFSERAVYVIDGQGVIRYAHVSPYLHHLPDLDELLDALERVQPKEEAIS